MLLKVGELAKRTGVTVRALHHYDSIGVLRPSGRSEGGYRLYSREDVARLHGIQTLRRMGVPLAEVARLLGGGASSLPAIVARQIGALDREIDRTQALRERLGVIQLILAGGGQPEIDDWLATLAMMSTFEQYFSVGELTRALERWKPQEAEWPALVQAIRAAMGQGVPSDGIEIQPLAQRWIGLATRWMDSDIEFLGRWGTMLREQPSLPLPAGMDLELLDYIDAAIRRRLAVLARYIPPELQHRLVASRPQWHALMAQGQRLLADGVPPDAPAARALARDWRALMERTVGSDSALGDRLIAAYESEPLLRAGMPFTPALRLYVEQASNRPRALDSDAASGLTMRAPQQPGIDVSAMPPNIVRRGEPSLSALRVASLRAVHQLLDDPLVLHDPIALPLLGASAAAALRDDPFALNDPISRGLRAGLVARSRFVEDELSRCVAQGVRQYVVLGAGLDTFAYRSRYAADAVRVFEVDHAGTQRWKQRLLSEAGIGVPAFLSFVAADFERDNPGAALAQAGFRADRPACVSWMGVTAYLSEEAVQRTLRMLAGLAAASCVCFDHRVRASLLGPVDRAIDEFIARQAADAGEPWLSSFDPAHLERQLLGLGFGSAVSVTSDDLNTRYFARRKDGLRTGGGFRIVRAGVGG